MDTFGWHRNGITFSPSNIGANQNYDIYQHTLHITTLYFRKMASLDELLKSIYNYLGTNTPTQEEYDKGGDYIL